MVMFDYILHSNKHTLYKLYIKDLINDIINNWFREEYLIINESIIDLFD